MKKCDVLIVVTIVFFIGLTGISYADFTDDFNDGNFIKNPVWEEVNRDDYPGNVSVENGSIKFYRTGAGGNGGSVGIEIATDIAVNDSTIVVFDGKATYRSVGAGCGWKCNEFPANVQLYLENSYGEELKVRYAINYGDAVEDQDNGNYKQRTVSIRDLQEYKVPVCRFDIQVIFSTLNDSGYYYCL